MNLKQLKLAGPSFSSWVLVVVLSMAIYFKFAAVVFLSVTTAVVCRPLYERLVEWISSMPFLKARPAVAHGLASLTTQLLASLFVLVCVLAPVWVLVQNRTVIMNSAVKAYDDAREWSRCEIQTLGWRLHVRPWTDFNALPSSSDILPQGPSNLLQERTLPDQVVEIISRPAPYMNLILDKIGQAAVLLGKLMVFFMATHFLLLHGPTFWRQVLARSPAAWRPTLAYFGRRSRIVLMATCVVHGLTAVSAFVIALPVFWVVVGAEHFLLLAVLAGLFQLIPLLGAATLVTAMTVYYFATGHILQGWESLFLAFPFIVGVPDLLVRPYLAERFGRVHAITMLAGFITGLEVFGLLGFILGPYILDLIVQFTNQVLLARGETASKHSVEK